MARSATRQKNNQDVETLVEKKKSWVRNKQENFGEENVQPGNNSKYLRFAMASLDLPPIDISDEKQVEKRIREYFVWCIENDKKPQKVEMSMWLGIDITTVRSWQNGECRAQTHSPVIRRADAILHSLWVDYTQNGLMNPASSIFLGKNMFGYADTYQITPAPASPLGEDPDAKALQERADNIVIDAEDVEVE